MSDKDDYIKLKAIWYKKLKDSGFEDAETPGGFLKDWPTQRLSRDYTPEKFKEKEQYFQLASQFYWDHQFNNALEKKVWCLHIEGFSNREIALKLRTPKNKMNRGKINEIILRLSKLVRGMLLYEEE